MGREIGSILCDTLKKVAFSDGLGGGILHCAVLLGGVGVSPAPRL